jgi:hypothetical protein
MRGTVAKQIRKRIYGTGHHLGPVRYYKNAAGEVEADTERQRYQYAKKQHNKKES